MSETVVRVIDLARRGRGWASTVAGYIHLQDYRFAFGGGNFVIHYGLGFVDLHAALEELDAGQYADTVFSRARRPFMGVTATSSTISDALREHTEF